jgi:thymidylate synthase (FAD)
MKLIKQSFEVVDWGVSNGIEILKKIERAGRTCYKSESQISEDSCIKFVRMLDKSGHHSVIEHHNVTCKIITNRGVTHELVRHRLCSFSQESTRYCNYSGEMLFIEPVWGGGYDKDVFARDEDVDLFINALIYAEGYYNDLINIGWRSEQAREVLPNALATEIIVTANIREWKHIFNLRCSKKAHPQIRALMLDGLEQFKNFIPVLFDGLWEKYRGKND